MLRDIELHQWSAHGMENQNPLFLCQTLLPGLKYQCTLYWCVCALMMHGPRADIISCFSSSHLHFSGSDQRNFLWFVVPSWAASMMLMPPFCEGPDIDTPPLNYISNLTTTSTSASCITFQCLADSFLKLVTVVHTTSLQSSTIMGDIIFKKLHPPSLCMLPLLLH